MKRSFLCLILSLFAAGCAGLNGTPATPQEISGILIGKTVLRGQIIMTADILVPVGSELVIRPGTTILVRDSESTKIDPEFLSAQTELLVRGSLVVEGRPDAVVTFLPEVPAATGAVAWAGIILDGATGSAIRQAVLIQPDTGFLLINSSPDLIGNTISKARYGIVVQGGTARILGNEISLGEGGIFCWNQARPYLQDNRIFANDEEGIFVDRSSKPYLDRNMVSGNGIGLIVPEHVPYDPSLIAGNRVDLRVLPSVPERLP